MRKPKSVRDCALFLLEYSDRTEKELRQKLAEREYEPKEIDEALSFLKEYHYIDDAAYAGKYIRVYSARKSVRQIRADLQRKGIAAELIDQWLEETPVDETAQIQAYLKKKGYRPGEFMEPDAYRKVTAALCRKGFSYEVVRKAMKHMCEETF
ncbi:MAG: regulatory protein RecX [Lachnospiraceae bacterium]|nr:regulatory protein RecX [Lachnospiraceae bacterium]